MTPLKKIIQFVLEAFAPFVLIAVGAGIAGIGTAIGSMTIWWIGIAVAVFGVLWFVLTSGGIDLF